MSDNILGKLIEAAAAGRKWRVDFKSRSAKIDGEYLVKDGVYNVITGMDPYPSSQFIRHLEYLYQVYKHSMPSERSESKRKRYFKALAEHELDDSDMMYGVCRDMAQAELEGFVLGAMLEGLSWDESWGKWFWQSKNDPDLVLLREWFEPKGVLP